MSTQECSICMDPIDFNKNCVTTECDHCFHTNCLMKSVAYTGFGCPYCRTEMAEKPEVKLENDDDSELTSMYSSSEWTSDDEEEIDEQVVHGYAPDIPNPTIVADELIKQGYTFEDLVKIILHEDHDEYNDDPEMADAVARNHEDLFGKVRMLIARHNCETEEQPDYFEAQSKKSVVVRNECI